MKKNKISLSIFCSLIIALLVLLACSKDSVESTIPDDDSIGQGKEDEKETFNYTSDATYNLNVVYFIPAGSENRAESHRRLSEILLQGQGFFKQEMVRNGFGDKTFNLLLDNDKNRVKIDYVNGKFGASNYPYEGGGSKMIEEIEVYYAANPGVRTSEHVLVLSPVADPRNNDAPYYGLGKYCFATDYDDMDIQYLGGNSELSNLATIYIGGLLHELGHGLNLPHNKERVSQENNVSFGTALMGAGNYTYGSEPTFLTAASCAILNNNQVFNQNSGDFYSGASATIDGIMASYENGNILISGDVATDIPVESISIYNDPADDNADYDAVTWLSMVENNAFEVSMPINELHKKGNTEYVLRFLLNHTNGDITRISYFYEFKNGTPVIAFGEQDYLDRTNWSITNFSSQEDSGGEGDTGRASDILDGDSSTYWHSCWSSGCTNNEYPHSLTIDTGANTTVNGFSFIQRSSLSRSIKDIEIRISDDNIIWHSLGHFELKNVNSTQNIQLDQQASFRYFEIVSKSAHDGQQFAALAEVFCY